MAEQRLIMAIGQLERALSRIEVAGINRTDNPNQPDDGLLARHENLKSETRLAIQEIDQLLKLGAN